MRREEMIKKELAKLLGEDVVEEAFRMDVRNAFLAGVIDARLRGRKRRRASQLLKELGPDELFQSHFGLILILI